jgi:glycerol-3-phosphate dehydrogenase
MIELSHRTRRANIEQLQRESLDLLVIGGGITGAGIAQDAAARGLKTGLIEKGDFAGGTSSKSSKLIHGGLRYLKQLEFRLTLAAVSERNLLHHLAPSLVTWLPFLIPIYPWMTGSTSLSIGLWLYDALSRFGDGETHRKISPTTALSLAPSLRPEELRSGLVYRDCQTDDARLVLTVIKSAAERGTRVANYVQAIGFLKAQGRICGVAAVDQLTGERFEIRTNCVVNATGVWADHLRTKDDPQCDHILFQSKGIHIIIPQAKLGVKAALLFYSPRDNRALFAIPADPVVILGTTDTPYEGDVDAPRASVEEAEYILEAANRTFNITLTKGDIISVYAGVRPLLKEDKAFASDISRKHRIYESDSGLISVGGGKLTTYRRMAQEVVDRVAKRLNRGGRCMTQEILLLPTGDSLAAASMALDPDVLAHLQNAYGMEAKRIIEIASEAPDLKERVVVGLPYIKAEVVYSIRHEMAMTLTDVLSRRMRLVWQDRDHGLGCADEMAQLMASQLGWSQEQTRAQIEAYKQEVELHRLPE